MNNARVNCPKCQKMFPNQQLLVQHSRKCGKEDDNKMDTTEKEELKMDTNETEEVKADGFKVEVKDPLGGGNLEIDVSPSNEKKEPEESVNWDKTEEETMALLKGYNDFIKNNDAIGVDLEKKVQESEKKVLEVSKNSIEISDDDDDDRIPRLPDLPPGMRNSNYAGAFKAFKPPPQSILKPLPKLLPKLKPLPPILPRQSLMNRAGAGFRRLNPLQCYYCGKLSSDRISVARHMIASHWVEVREKQGGGRRDNSAYYASIQDSRVIRPEPGKFPRTPQPIAQKTSQVMNNVSAATSVPQPGTSPRWLDKLGGGMKANVNKKVRQVHNPSWYGTPPNRNIAPKPSVGKSGAKSKNIPFEATFDLTKDDPEACSVCDDDFNWPDENHECKRTRQKDPNKLNSVNRNKVLQPVSVSSNRSSSKTAPISVPIKTGGKDFRNLVKKLSTNSRALQITPVMKK